VIIPVESEEDGGVESRVDSALEDYRSVISIDSIAENADFISLE
jgi:hypothetical protein